MRAGNGYQPDLHEFQITPQGTALITVYSAINCDLARVGGPRDGAVADTLLQEIDLRTGLVMYEWHSLDHVALPDSYARRACKHADDAVRLLPHQLDRRRAGRRSARRLAQHLGRLRHRSAQGQVRWKLGGKHSSFAMGPGTRTAWQHDARQQPDGTITFFDNGATPVIHATRALEPAPGPRRQSRHRGPQLRPHAEDRLAEPGQRAGAQQRGLGGRLGQASYFSQLGPDGEVLFDAHLPLASESFRAYRQDWSATPETQPTISYEPAASTGATGRVYVSWNGATDVAAWRLLSGPAAGQLRTRTTVQKNGFETVITVPAGETDAYVQVQGLSSSGAVLGASASER